MTIVTFMGKKSMKSKMAVLILLAALFSAALVGQSVSAAPQADASHSHCSGSSQWDGTYSWDVNNIRWKKNYRVVQTCTQLPHTSWLGFGIGMGLYGFGMASCLTVVGCTAGAAMITTAGGVTAAAFTVKSEYDYQNGLGQSNLGYSSGLHVGNYINNNPPALGCGAYGFCY